MLLSSVDEQSPEPMEALCGKEEGTEMAIRHVDMTQGAEGEGDSKHAKKKASSSKTKRLSQSFSTPHLHART